jgi:hypothetical protein
MFSRLFGFLIIIGLSYLMLIFIIPTTADQYWNKELNTKIREYKNISLQFASGSDTPISLFDKLKGGTQVFIQDTKNNIQGLETSVDSKVKQVHEASIAVENAYSGVIDATQKIQNLTGTGR